MRGGKRLGAGRKKGTPNKSSRARQEQAAAGGIMPVDFLLTLMRDRTLPNSTRMEAAVKVAPYIHPRLAPIESTESGSFTALVEACAKQRLGELVSDILQSIDGAGTGLAPHKQ